MNNRCVYCGRTQEVIDATFLKKAELICSCCNHCQECKLIAIQHKAVEKIVPYEDKKISYADWGYYGKD